MGTKERFLVEGENEALTLPEKREKRKEKKYLENIEYRIFNCPFK